MTHKLAEKKVRACCQWGSGQWPHWPQWAAEWAPRSGGANFFGVAEGKVSLALVMIGAPTAPSGLHPRLSQGHAAGTPFSKFWASAEVKGTQGLVKGQQLCALGSWLLVCRDAHHQRAL